MSTFTRKGYGRIYVGSKEEIESVENIIKEIDDYEFKYYYPKGLVTTFDEFPNVIYLHKFCDIDKNHLTSLCWSKGIKIWCFDNGHCEYSDEFCKGFNN